MNIITALQSAAHSARFRCPSTVSSIQTYGEARGGNTNKPFPFMGLRRFVIDYLSQPITTEMIDEAQSIASSDFDREMWEYIVREHCGYLPIKIVGKKEGQISTPGEVLWTVESKDSRCALLPLMIEKLIVSHVWFESTLSQRLRFLYKAIADYCQETGYPRKIATYYAGGSTLFGDEYTSQVANALIFFFFTQSIDVNTAKYVNRHYGMKLTGTKGRISEHSSVLMWDDDESLLSEMLDVHSHEWFSILTDTHSYYDFFEEVLPEFGEAIKSRHVPMSLAIDCEDHVSAHRFARESLKRTFGFEINHEGYKHIDAPVFLAQIEDLTLEDIQANIKELIDEKWSPIRFYWHISDLFMHENLTRDTNGFISKVCHVKYEGCKSRDVHKNPKENPNKLTKKGIQRILDHHVYFDGGFFDFDPLSRVRERLLK